MRKPFPLQWPEGFQRTKPANRARSRFGQGGQVSFSNARRFLLDELDAIGGINGVITSELPTRADGLPYATSRLEADPGIALWFVLEGAERVMPCDRWLTHAENMQAIGKTIEAMRGIDRWGSADVVTRAFSGFAALPPGSSGSMPVGPRPWREVLGGGAWPELAAAELLAIAKTRHRKLIAEAHPDAGGDVARAAEINVAMEAAERELS